MIQYHIYPGGKRRILTFSYDDGRNDEPLVALFNKYKVKATFHLNGSDMSEQELLQKRNLYKGHEISCHTSKHGWPSRMPMQSVVTEVLTNRLHLEQMAQHPVIGMSYPSGSYNDDAISAMRAAGIVYSRTVNNTMRFDLPDDFMRWHPTCHHVRALELCDSFLGNPDSPWTLPLFYIWGHSHEFKTDEDWAAMEKTLQKLSDNDKIWYATNIEIYNYMTAQKSLQITADEKCFYNPTSIDLWVEKDKTQIIKIPAGQQINL